MFLFNGDTFERGRFDDAFALDLEWHALVCRFQLVVCLQLGLNGVEYLVLRVQLGRRLTVVAFDDDAVADGRAGRRIKEFDFLRAARAQNHALGEHVPQLGRLQVAQQQDKSVLHLVDGHVFDEAAHHGASLALAHINLLDIQSIGIGMLLHLHNFAHSNVQVGDVVVNSGCCFFY